jgi:hypothetical protein
LARAAHLDRGDSAEAFAISGPFGRSTPKTKLLLAYRVGKRERENAHYLYD